MDNMKIAFIILAYKNPRQLRWLIESLNHENHFFFIHVDQRQNIQPFEKELNLMNGINWTFTERYNSFWGSYSCVKAVIEAMKMAKEKLDFDYYIHLSGQDFPVVTPNELQRKLAEVHPASYFFNFPFNEGKWDNKGKDRLETIHFFRNSTRVAITKKTKNPLYAFLHLLWRKAVVEGFDQKQTYYGCEFYFMFHKDALERLLENQRKFRLLHYRLTFTVIPEEVYISTMLMAGKENDKIKIMNDTGRYIKWDPVGSSPKTLDEKDFDAISQGEYLFARKFDFEGNEIFLKTLSNFIQINSNQKNRI
ncbi:MAG: hypothetical protein RL582_858 [Bacteroidota bacterium]